MNFRKIVLLILTAFAFLAAPLLAAGNQNIPPEELDRQKKAKAKLERARQKSKQTAPAPAAAPAPASAPAPSYYQPVRQAPVRYAPRNNDYKDESGPAYEEPSPEPGVFIIESEPAGAEVWFKGKFLGKTPVTINDKPGSYPLVIKYSGFEDTSIGAIILAGQKRIVRLLLDEQ
ncbi:MAG: PEGA domain-containing protein [Firmicutes bacterium]|nr:PEGA domain-containing protein [Bacillota bacterium]